MRARADHKTTPFHILRRVSRMRVRVCLKDEGYGKVTIKLPPLHKGKSGRSYAPQEVD